MNIARFSQINEGFFIENEKHFWNTRQKMYDLGFDDKDILDYFIDDIGKDNSKKILDTILYKLEKDDI